MFKMRAGPLFVYCLIENILQNKKVDVPFNIFM